MMQWLAMYAGGFVVVGVAVGVGVHHFCLGWFISVLSKDTLEQAVRDAERHLTRRTQRRRTRERARRILAANGAATPAGRHQAARRR
ncbi:MAG TPA: hypothetical protein VID07_11580 [Actinomycetes bacterium]|jgi:hypothetical protein